MKKVYLVFIAALFSITAFARDEGKATRASEDSPVREVLVQWTIENQQAVLDQNNDDPRSLVQEVTLRSKPKRKCARYYTNLDNYSRVHLNCGVLVNIPFERLRRMACMAEDVSTNGFNDDPFCKGL